jgi:hypothetical protein
VINDSELETQEISSVADYLSKPIAVASGQFTTSNTWGDNLYSADITSLIMAQPMWANKLQGFLSMRGTVNLRLTINPNPFQAGLLKVSYFPCQNQMVQEATAHRYNRVTISQLPGPYISCQMDSVEMKVPYLAPTTFMQRDKLITNTHVSWGRVYIDVFEILTTGSSGPLAVNWTLWLSVEDLELSGQILPQALGKKVSNVTDAESNSGKGPISMIMSSGAKLASSMSVIPSLAPLAKPAYWALTAASAAAEALGWSKPTVSEGPMFHATGASWFSTNVDSNDQCMPMSLTTDNKLIIATDSSPGQMDEMSFNFIKTRWSYFRETAWANTALAGSLLTDFAIGPQTFLGSHTVNGIPCVTAAPCAVFQEFFAQYRGSFEIRVRLVKTGFHSGTLAFGYLPGKASTPPTYIESAYCHRQIIDIQEGEEWCFNLPYLLPDDFTSIYEQMGRLFIYVVNPLVAPDTVGSTIYLMFEVRGGPDLVYNVPIQPGAVPFVPQALGGSDDSPPPNQKILPITEKCTLCFEDVDDPRQLIIAQMFDNDDFRRLLAEQSLIPNLPYASLLAVVNGVTLFLAKGTSLICMQKVSDYISSHFQHMDEGESAVFEPQGADTQETGEASCVTLSSSQHVSANVHHAALAHGEIMQSFTQLLKADWQILGKTSVTEFAPIVVMASHRFYGTRYNGAVQSSPIIGGDPMSFIASWFLFHRGSIRYHFTSSSNVISGTDVNLRAILLNERVSVPFLYDGGLPANSSWLTKAISGQRGGSSRSTRLLQISAVNGALPVQVPFYCSWRYGLNHIATSDAVTYLSYTNDQSIALNWASGATVSYGRSIGDDFQFSFFLGIPLYCSAFFVYT